MLKKILAVLAIAFFVTAVGKLAYAQHHEEHKAITEKKESTAQHHEEHKTGADTKASHAGDVKKAVSAGNTICPVTGEKIKEKGKLTVEYKGKIYDFCCAACVPKFKKDPEKYLKKLEAKTKKQKKSAKKEETHKVHEHPGH